MDSASNLTFFTKYIYILFIGIALFVVSASGYEDECKHVHYDQLHHQIDLQNKNPKYVCFHGYNGTSVWAIWSNVVLSVKTKGEQSIKFIKGQSCKEVIDKYNNESSSWLPSLTAWFPTTTGETLINTLPYDQHCFAIYSTSSTNEDFSIEVNVHKLRIFYPVLMVIGILLFLNADDISRNVVFYYSCGISMGMILSILLLVFIISRLIPKRSVGYAFLFCGSSFVAYILQLTKHHITSKPFEGNWIIFSYFIVSGLVSFLYCYYRGPVTSGRGFDIMRWCLQAFALFLVYYGIRCEKIALAFLLVLILTRWISLEKSFAYTVTWKWMPIRFQTYLFKRKLISMEEYETQGCEETARALKLLQEYCTSPDCDTWKTVSRLKSPKRFASFISGGEHITDEERREYDEISFDAHPFMTSDEDSDTELAKMSLDFTETSESLKEVCLTAERTTN